MKNDQYLRYINIYQYQLLKEMFSNIKLYYTFYQKQLYNYYKKYL